MDAARPPARGRQRDHRWSAGATGVGPLRAVGRRGGAEEAVPREDVVAIEAAIEAAKKVTDKPSLICLRTIIGYPAPDKMNTGAVHGVTRRVDRSTLRVRFSLTAATKPFPACIPECVPARVPARIIVCT